MDFVLENIFLIGVVSLVLGVVLFLLQVIAVRVLRFSSERIWTLKIWPASLVAIGIVGMTLPAAITQFAPMINLGERDRQVDGQRHITLTGWNETNYRILERMPDVAQLQMANPDVTDQTLESLRGMTQLRVLDIARTAVTDAGLPRVGEQKGLQKLYLAGTKITDAGLQPVLDQLPDLQTLDVRDTGITPELLRKWKAAKSGRRCLPNPSAEPAPAPSDGPSSSLFPSLGS